MKTKKQYSAVINIPDNVDIKKIEDIFYFQGPLGKTALHLKKIDPKGLAGVLIETNEKKLRIITTSKAFYGLLKSIIYNKLQGVSRGFLIYLKIIGIGYRANLVQNESSKLVDLKSNQRSFFDLMELNQRFNSIKNQPNQTLFLKLGYSHDIVYKIPSSIRIFLLDPTLICLFGVDKNQITQIAAQIRNLRRPTVYKGKGIRLLNENILLKAGKRK